MPLLDVALIIVLAGFVFYGFFFGLIRTIGSLAGVILGAYVASKFYLDVFGWIENWWRWQPNTGKIISFIICFTAVSRLIGWAFSLFQQAFNVAAAIPFVKGLNRLFGAVFGFIEGALAAGLILYVAGRYVPEGTALALWIDESALVAFLIAFSKILAPLLPELYKKVKSLI